MPVLKNAKHEAFAQGIAKGKTADQAYETAGYKPNRGNAARLKAYDSIRKRVAEILERAAEKAEIDVARTLKELARIGLSDVRQLFTMDGQLKKLHELDDATAAAIASIEVVASSSIADEDGKPLLHTHKIKLWDKNSALEKIAKHLGMLTEKHEHNFPGLEKLLAEVSGNAFRPQEGYDGG